jgi:putative acetyltransferase
MTTPPLRFALRALMDYDSAWLAEITDLWVESWQATLPAIDFEARRGWFVDHVTHLRANGSVIRIAVMQTGDAAGFVAIDPSTGYLDQILVGVPWWGRGVAEILLNEARRLSPTVIRLAVNQDNPRAVGFYRRQGFVVTAEGVNPRSGLATFTMTWEPVNS